MKNIAVEAVKKFGDEQKLPPPSYSSYLNAKDKGDWAYAVKPINEHQKSCAGVDHSKPMRAYLKLDIKDKEKHMECLTKICDSDGNNHPPQKCMSTYGSYHPIVK